MSPVQLEQGYSTTVELLFSTPVIVKVFVSLALVLVVNTLCRRLSLSLAAGTALLAAWSGHSVIGSLDIAWERLVSPNNLLLIAVIFEVSWLGAQMSASGIMSDLVQLVRSRVSQRTAIGMLPALIGFLPMPGGALFSAPLVGDCDREGAVDPQLKTQINYWFRHVWEFWWPLFPGVLLALELTKLDVWQFILLQLPLSVFAIVGGHVFLLRGIPPGDRHGRCSGALLSMQFLHLLMPIVVVVVGYTSLRLTVPALTQLNKYLPMLAGVVLAMGFVQLQRPLGWQQWRRILLSKRLISLAVLVCLVRTFGAFVEAPLPSGLSPMEQMRAELNQWGIPLMLVAISLPFVSGLASGLAVGFVGASFPVVLSLLGDAPSMQELLAATVLTYGFGYLGMMLSPVHICLIVTNQHFESRLAASLPRLMGPAATVAVGTLLLHLCVKLLPQF